MRRSRPWPASELSRAALRAFGATATAAGDATVVTRVSPGSHRPRDRPGPHRVPAHLEQRAPAHRARARRLGRPRRRVHRGHPARHDGRGGPLLPRATCGASASRGCGRCGNPPLRRTLDARIGWYLIIGTIPIGVFGLIFKDQIESGARDLRLIGTTLIVLGLVLLVADRIGPSARPIDDLDRRDGVAFGVAQSLALVPGVSRSGATITAGLFLGYTREPTRPGSRSCCRSPPSCSRACSSCGTSATATLPGAGRHDPRHPACRSSSATRRSRGCCAGWRATARWSSSCTASRSASSCSPSSAGGVIDAKP